jgi:excisionase family DNA binding protein
MHLPEPAERPWLTVAEVAQITGEGEKAIRAALDAGQLPLLRVGRYVRIPTARLRQVLGIDPEMADTATRSLEPPTPLRPVSGL